MDAITITFSRILNVLIVICAVLFAYLMIIILLKRFVAALSVRLPIIQNKKEADPRIKSVLMLLLTTARWSLGLFALFTILNEFEINIAPLIAGAGIAGIALSFAAQAILKDIASGITILTGDHFRVGDTIVLNGIQGVVEQIGLMKTLVRDKQTLYYIPNGQISMVGVVQTPIQRTRGMRHR